MFIKAVMFMLFKLSGVTESGLTDKVWMQVTVPHQVDFAYTTAQL